MIVELSHQIHHGMTPYPGLPAPRVTPHLTHEASRPNYGNQAEFTMTKLEMVGNVGTYLDSPYHRYPHGPDISRLPLDALVELDAVVIRAPAVAGPLTAELPGGDLRGTAVLIATGWDARWDTDAYWEPGPFLSEELVASLVAAKVGLVGVDCWNVDDTSDLRRPVHTTLLGHEIPIVEHLRGLTDLPANGFTFSAVPLNVVGAAALPVRAYARLP